MAKEKVQDQAMDLSAPGLENPIVRFESLTAEHRNLVFASEIEEAVWRWMPALQGGTNLQNYFDFMLAAQKCGRAVTFVLFRQDDNTFVGLTGFNDINKIHRRLRNALTWHPPHLESQPLYLAGQLAMIQRAYAWRAKRLEWQINTNNSYILRGIELLRATQDAHFRNYERTADGVWVDKVVYSMTRPEMAETIERLNTELFA